MRPTYEELEAANAKLTETLRVVCDRVKLCMCPGCVDAAKDRAEDALAYIHRLHSIIKGLTERVAAQSEILSRKAEKMEKV